MNDDSRGKNTGTQHLGIQGPFAHCSLEGLCFLAHEVGVHMHLVGLRYL